MTEFGDQWEEKSVAVKKCRRTARWHGPSYTAFVADSHRLHTSGWRRLAIHCSLRLVRPQNVRGTPHYHEPNLARNAPAAVPITSALKRKGLQYKAVLVLWTDMLPAGADATDEERRLLYVAITRAENDLVLLGSGAGSFDLKFKETCAVRHFPFSRKLHAVA